MKVFGKKPASLLVAGSFALALTSCKEASSSQVPNASSAPGHVFAEFLEKVSRAIRGGFGGSALPGQTNRSTEEEWADEDFGAGG
jgi:hypothetical protein